MAAFPPPASTWQVAQLECRYAFARASSSCDLSYGFANFFSADGDTCNKLVGFGSR